MRRKLVNGIRRYTSWVIQFFKRTFIRLLGDNILISKKTFIGRGVKIRALRGALVDIRGVYIKDYAHIYAGMDACIRIGQNAQVGMFNVLVAKEKITIGENTLLAEFVSIRDQDHDLNDLDSFKILPVTIGAGVWVGSKVTVTKGVKIGDKAVIGANSVVTRDIEERSVTVGSPARIIKKIE